MKAKIKEVMNLNRKGFKSILEFEKKYFPKAYRNKTIDRRITDPEVYGASLASEFIEEFKKRLTRK